MYQGGITAVLDEMRGSYACFTCCSLVSAGIDLMLAFIADVAGKETAGVIQLGAEYYPSRKLYKKAHQDEKAPRYLKESS